MTNVNIYIPQYKDISVSDVDNIGVVFVVRVEDMETESQNVMEKDIMDGLQQLIGDELEKYHEDKIKRDQGQETNPRPGPGRGMKNGYKKKFPQALLQQYLTLN